MLVTLEPIWVTGIIINTQSITNNGKIQYTINPEEADNKTITFDTKITPDYTIDAAGNVVINADCSFEVVARSQFGKDYSEVIGRKTITGYNRVAVKSITITTTTIQDTGYIQTSVSPVNASIVKKEFELLSGSEYVVMDNTGYVSEVKSPGTISVRVSGFDKAGNVVTDTKSIAATNEFVKITGVSITTDTVNEGDTIAYKTTPTSVPANLKSVKIELYNQGNSDYVTVNIDDNGKVTGITEGMDGKTFKAKITVVDKYDNVVSNTKEITCKFIVLLSKIYSKPTTITDTGELTTFFEPANATILGGSNVKVSTNSDCVVTTVNGYLPMLKWSISNGWYMVSKVDVLKDGTISCGGHILGYTKYTQYGHIFYNDNITLKKTTVTIPVTSITVPNQTITDEGVVNYTISPSNTTNKDVKFSFKSSTSNATIDSSTGKITVTNDGGVVVVVTAQDGSGIKGEGFITLKKTPVIPINPTIVITPDSLTDSGTIAYTITPETSCQFAIINGTFDAVTIGTAGDVNIDNNMMWFVGAKTIDIASVKYDSNLVVRVSCMDGSGYYVDKSITVHKTEEQPLIITSPILSSERDTQTLQITTNKSNAKFVKSWFISDMLFNEVAQPTGVINAYIVRVDESGLLTYKTYLSDRIPGSTMVSIQQMIDNTAAITPINSFVEGYTYCGTIELDEECTANSITYATLQATITAYTPTLTSTVMYDKSDYVS